MQRTEIEACSLGGHGGKVRMLGQGIELALCEGRKLAVGYCAVLVAVDIPCCKGRVHRVIRPSLSESDGLPISVEHDVEAHRRKHMRMRTCQSRCNGRHDNRYKHAEQARDSSSHIAVLSMENPTASSNGSLRQHA